MRLLLTATMNSFSNPDIQQHVWHKGACNGHKEAHTLSCQLQVAWLDLVSQWQQVVPCKDLQATQNPEFPQTSLDQTEIGPRSGHSFKNIFGLGWVGDKDFGPVRVGVFFIGYHSIFSENLMAKWN